MQNLKLSDSCRSQETFDYMIGRLDRLLSEFLLLCPKDAKERSSAEWLDEANRQTLKHHADDLIGVGQEMLARLK